MLKVLPFFQIIIGFALIFTIMIQSKGAGISNPMTSSEKGYQTLRGPEKMLFVTTIVLVVLFLLSSFLNVLFS